MMKNNKRLLILSIIAALSISSMTGCGNGGKNSKNDDKSSSSNTQGTTYSNEELMKQPITFYYGQDEDDSDDNNLDDPDPVAPNGNGGDSESYVAVTEADGTPVTEYVAVTDAKGEKVTDSNGADVTEAVQVTSAVSNNNQGGNNSNQGGSNQGGNNNNQPYTPQMKEAWAMWLDISQDEDYIFNDEFIEVTFKIKDNAPAGAYDVNITDPDFACMFEGGTTLPPDTVLNGKVYVSEDLVPQRELTDADGFTVYADNVAGKPGDEVTLYFRLKDNPGMIAMMFRFEYDKNAMSIVSCSAVGEFMDIARPSFNNPAE